MSVKVISYTQHSDDSLDLKEYVAYVARVSNPSNQNNTSTSNRLIKYLIKNQHWSPFEMANVCMEIITTRDIARQILRHRSFSFQEFSQRYADPTESLEFVTREARLQDEKNRQNSIEISDDELQNEWTQKQKAIINLCKSTYEWAKNKGIAKEVIRSVLPEGMMQTKLYMNGTIRSWIHYISLRSDISTQKEHRNIALLCKNELSKVFPELEGIC